MKEIKLTQGQVALVDDEDFEYLNQFKWHAKRQRTGIYYAHRYSSIAPKRISMHSDIITIPNGLMADHIDHNGLNNQKYNLRTCTKQQNCMNRVNVGAVKYRGVRIRYNKYETRITFNGVSYNLGRFNILEDAAKAYDAKAKELFGEFANLNFK